MWGLFLCLNAARNIFNLIFSQNKCSRNTYLLNWYIFAKKVYLIYNGTNLSELWRRSIG
jgi:hypothetical protein